VRTRQRGNEEGAALAAQPACQADGDDERAEGRTIVRQTVGLALTLMLCTSAYAADGPAERVNPSVGSRVRITSGADGEPVTGTLLSIDVDALVIRRAGVDASSRILIAEIVKLEVSGGQRSQVGRGAMIGGAVGVMPGLLLTVGDYSSDVHGDSHAGTVAAIGAAGGALLGAAIGWALKSEKWIPSEVPRAAVAAVPLPRGVAVSFRLTWGSGSR
jgi:hypothetical protein